MKGYNRWRQDMVPKLQHMAEFVLLGKRLGVNRPDLLDAMRAEVSRGATTDFVWNYIDVLKSTQAAFTAVMSNTIITRHFLLGPKVFSPSPGEFAALCQIEPNLAWDDYQQPFPNFCMAVPEREAAPMNNKIGKPSAVVLDFEPAAKGVKFMAYIPCEPVPGADLEAGVTKFDICMVRPENAGEPTMAAFLRGWIGDDAHDDKRMVLDYGMDTTDVRPAAVRLVAAAVNAALLLTRHGCVHRGKSNPLHAASLERSLAKKKLPDNLRATLKRDLLTMPDIYSFSQEIKLHDSEGEPGEPGDPTGREMPSHWRRGHWARQRHGAGLAETKLIFRKPVLVRADRFGGDLANTGATYQGA